MNDKRRPAHPQRDEGPERGPRTHTVEEGETLQSLAARFYGRASEWERLYEANRDVLGDDSNLPRPGTELFVPRG